VDVGNLVGQGEPTLLTTVRQQDPLYVYFNVSERDLLGKLRERAADSRGQRLSDLPESERIRVFLQLSDGTDYSQPCTVEFIDNALEAGTLSVRALVPNPDQLLYPGLFVRVRVPQKKEGAILVPEVAVQRDLAGYFVMAVDESDVVERVEVEVGTKLASRRVIESGLEPGTRVVVNGLLRARPGIRVSLSSEGSASPADDEEGGR
jgi:RND family efflux transporter MFP subunit